MSYRLVSVETLVFDTENQTQNPGFYDVYQLTDVRPGEPVGGSLHAHFSRAGSRVLWGDLEHHAGCFGNWRLVIAPFRDDTVPPSLGEPTYLEPGDSGIFEDDFELGTLAAWSWVAP